jgi:hypothetical protein
MKQSNVSRYAYLAGFIDGEGCISAQDDKRYAGQCFLQLHISQKDGRVIDWLHGTFGGNVFENITSGWTAGSTIYRWDIYSDGAANLLKKTLPFLRVKKRQAELAIQLQSRLGLRGGDHRNGKRNLTDHEIAIRRHLVQEIRDEKRRYPLSAAVETKRANRSMQNNGTKSIVQPQQKKNAGCASLGAEPAV